MKHIIIRKACRLLELWEDGNRITSFPIGLGKQPVGRKTAAGDGKTPEGRYYICTRNPKSKYHLSLGLSYPNSADAYAALAEERISEGEYQQICTAIQGKKRPPWDTDLGGEIMIHGGGASDWTAGCAALDDEHMDILWEACDIGTEVLILP